MTTSTPGWVMRNSVLGRAVRRSHPVIHNAIHKTWCKAIGRIDKRRVASSGNITSAIGGNGSISPTPALPVSSSQIGGIGTVYTVAQAEALNVASGIPSGVAGLTGNQTLTVDGVTYTAPTPGETYQVGLSTTVPVQPYVDELAAAGIQLIPGQTYLTTTQLSALQKYEQS